MIELYKKAILKKHNLIVTVVDNIGDTNDGDKYYYVETEEPHPEIVDGEVTGAFHAFVVSEDELEEIK